MEKIQAAIAKARASRITAGAAEEAPRPTPDQPKPAPAAEAEAKVAETPPERVPADAETPWLALPAFTPQPRLLSRNRILAFESGQGALPFSVIRTRMLQQVRANGWHRVGITSPGPGCGKTVLALNLAFSLARQSEQRTILIEADLRRPSMARYLGIKGKANVSKVLEGTAPLSDHAVRYGGNLIFSTQSVPMRSSAELLQSKTAAAALDTIAARYQPTIMLFDLPPQLASDDVMAFAGQLDAMLIVVAADSTTVKQIDQCERELAAQVNVMGVIVNKCRHVEKSDGYGYGY